MCLGKKDQISRILFSPYYIKGTYYLHGITVDTDLDHTAEILFLYPVLFCAIWKEVKMNKLGIHAFPSCSIYIFLDGAGTRPFWFCASRFAASLAANTILALITADILMPDDRK